MLQAGMDSLECFFNSGFGPGLKYGKNYFVI